MPVLSGEVTQLLLRWNKGDKDALDQLIPLVETELRRQARRYMRRERGDHTLQTSALINEAYVRLVDQQCVNFQDRAHFFAVAAQVMRHILIDYARRHRYAKRGGGAEKIDIDEIELSDQRAAELVAMDDALRDLVVVDSRKSQVVELRFFGGLTIEETAEVLNVSPATVMREWRLARAWLYHAISGNQE